MTRNTYACDQDLDSLIEMFVAILEDFDEDIVTTALSDAHDIHRENNAGTSPLVTDDERSYGPRGKPCADVTDLWGMTPPECAAAHPEKFTAFQATGTSLADLGSFLGDGDLDGCPGRIYCPSTHVVGGISYNGGLFIEDREGDKREPLPTGEQPWKPEHGKWYTIVDRSEYQSDDLESIEMALFQFALGEGYMDEVDEDEVAPAFETVSERDSRLAN